jgi:hypothetical protein
MDYNLVLNLAAIIVNLMVLRMLFEMSKQITEELDDLDHKMAEAIKGVVESGILGGIEPVNPIQQAIAHLLQSKIGEMGDTKPALTALRNTEGKFTQQD